ncbi:MAG: glycosyltransferase family 39 protein [Candidatus Paceibacterota bacterium]
MSTTQKICLIALFVLVIFFGFFHLTESPSFMFDEGWYFQTSANLATTGIDGIQMAPGQINHITTFLTVGYPLIYPLGLWFKIFSVGIFQARFLMALFLIGFVAASYLLSKKMYGSVVALAVLTMVATFPPLYGNGKSVMGEVPGLFYLLLFLISSWNVRADDARKIFWIVLSGLLAGLAVATKPTFIVIVPGILIASYLEWRRGTLSLKEIGIGAASMFIPVLIWLVVQFRAGDSLTETLNYYANPYSLTDVRGVILNNIRHLFSDVGPLYTVSLLLVWAVAFFMRIKARIKLHAEEIIAFAFSVLIFFAYLRTPGLYRYLLPAQLLSLIFFPYSLLYISEAISRKVSVWHAKRMYVIAIILLGILGVYQLGFNSWVAQTYSSHKTASLQAYFTNEIKGSESVFFYNTPDVVPFMHGRNYYQYIILFDRSLGSENLPVLAAGRVDKVVAPTNYFEADKTGVFDHYTEIAKVYKYSILARRQKI